MTSDLREREKLALIYTDRWALDPVSIDAAFLDRLRTCFTDQEIVEGRVPCAGGFDSGVASR